MGPASALIHDPLTALRNRISNTVEDVWFGHQTQGVVEHGPKTLSIVRNGEWIVLRLSGQDSRSVAKDDADAKAFAMLTE